MALNRVQFTDLIWRVLRPVEMASSSAVNLLLGTAAQESALGTYLRQVNGPALGIFQMEASTFDWLQEKYNHLKTPSIGSVRFAEFKMLEYDLWLSILFARLRYRVVPSPLPAADDIRGLAEYWKQHYNTHLGKGTVEQFRENYTKYLGGE